MNGRYLCRRHAGRHRQGRAELYRAVLGAGVGAQVGRAEKEGSEGGGVAFFMQDRNIVALDLATAARLFIGSTVDPFQFPYFVSVDHSPSEQLGHADHTMALVVSRNMEHQSVADEIAKELKRDRLMQWKRAGATYRKNFHRKLFHVLRRHPVMVVIIHATETNIRKHETYFINDIGAGGAYTKTNADGKTLVEIGPFIKNRSEKAETLKISEKHALMAAFSASCLLRLFDALRNAILEVSPATKANSDCWMQIWSDRPPNNFDGPYGQLMEIFLGASRLGGHYTWGGFTEDDNQQIDLLADNLCGLFNEIISGKKIYKYVACRWRPK